MRLVLLLLTLLALAAGCSRRERTNPLDPANPETGGQPQGFRALAGYALVSLSWTAQPALAIDGFQLWRLTPGDSAFRQLGGVLANSAGSFLDSGLLNGRDYRYRLYYVIRGTRSQSPAEDVATPGPLRVWVADYGAGLSRLTPDGRHVIDTATDAGLPQSLALDPVTGRLWTSDSFAGLVTARGADDPGVVAISGIHAPFTLAVDPGNQTAWICDEAGALAHFAADGQAASPASIGLLDDPVGIAVNRADRSFWVCEHAGNRVRHYAVTGAPLATAVLPAPSRVLADSATGLAWVSSTSHGVVWRLRTDGTVLDSTLVARGPLGMAIDHVHGRAWVADAGGGRLYGLDPVTLLVRVTIGGLGLPRDVDVDLATGDVWVVEQSSHAVTRFSLDGVLRQRCTDLVDPYEIRIDPGL